MEEAATRALALETHMEAAQARVAELQQSQVGSRQGSVGGGAGYYARLRWNQTLWRLQAPHDRVHACDSNPGQACIRCQG